MYKNLVMNQWIYKKGWRIILAYWSCTYLFRARRNMRPKDSAYFNLLLDINFNRRRGRFRLPSKVSTCSKWRGVKKRDEPWELPKRHRMRHWYLYHPEEWPLRRHYLYQLWPLRGRFRLYHYLLCPKLSLSTVCYIELRIYSYITIPWTFCIRLISDSKNIGGQKIYTKGVYILRRSCQYKKFETEDSLQWHWYNLGKALLLYVRW